MILKSKPVAIGARVKKCPHILTLGLRTNFQDYTTKEQTLIRQAPKIFFPTAFYADLLNAMGKPTFPSFHTYKFALDKIKQTAMFNLLGIPHPRTRIFYGRHPTDEILKTFKFPFIAKIPRGSARGTGVFMIKTDEELKTYLGLKGPAYIQKYLCFDRDMRIVVIGKQVILSYWRIAQAPGFKTNLAQGGAISYDPVPKEALDLALKTASLCGWDDVGIDIVRSKGRFYVLEGNMKYGTKGFQRAGINYKKLLASLILEGKV